MKQIYILRLWLIAAILSFASSASAYDVTVNDIFYNLDANTATASVTSGDAAYVGEVVIPSEITVNAVKYTVTSIGFCAFKDCTELTSVIVPNSVTEIGMSAFNGCRELSSITLPNSVTEIGQYAFYETLWFDNLPDGLVYIGKVLYKYKGVMPNNTSIAIKDGTISISGCAFVLCVGLTSVTIPNSVTSIGSEAFSWCSGLTSVTIPDSIKRIDGGAFYN